MATLSLHSCNYLLFLITISFLSYLPQTKSSLSTIAISETSNRTLICAILHSSNNRLQSYLNCTSFPNGSIPIITTLSQDVSGIVAGEGFVCNLRSTSNTSIINCRRFTSNGGNILNKRIYRGPSLYEFDAGNSHICGLVSETNRLECWQWYGFNNSKNSVNLKNIAVGEDFVCGLLENGKITCLGNRKIVGIESNGNYYSVIEAGFRHVCAIRNNGSLDCWGEIAGHDIPNGEFTSLALGENRSCGLRLNQTIVCWGENGFNLPERLRSTNFILIKAKRKIFCGLLASNYSLFCWGNNFNSNLMVFDNVMPGPCVLRDCQCGQLSGSGSLCDQGMYICQPCVTTIPRRENLPPPPPPPPESSSSGWNTKMVVFLVVGCFGSLILVLFLGFFLFNCKWKRSRVHDSGPLDDPNVTTGLTEQPPPTPLLQKRLSQLLSNGNGVHLEEFSLQVIEKVTSNFSEDHKIGTGSFGSVYHATLDDGRKVAIKRAESSTSSASYARLIIRTKKGQEQYEEKDNAFLNELQFLSRLNHKNLVCLLGFCQENNERVLVYEYLINGSLHDHLHKVNKKSTLINSWPARVKVALDTARGIEYLHAYADPPIIHRDIKSSNILLDKDFSAKLSDFGLSLIGPEGNESHLSLYAAGTVGYMDPEYYKLQQLSTKSDVYSFGVVLLELLCGYRAIHNNENGVPRNVVDYVVPYIVQDEIHRVLDRNVPPPTPVEIEAVAYVGYLAADCVTLAGRNRPTMSEIVNSLERALAACLQHPSFSRSTTTSTTESK